MSLRDLDYLFRPRSIALIGASNRPGTVGGVLAVNMLRAGFHGPVMPVNPKYDSIGGAPAWPDVASLPETPELGVVATPPEIVPRVVAELREKGAKAAAVITAGFAGGPDSAGHERRRSLLDAAGPMRILGPNILGFMAPEIGLNASFAHVAPRGGDLAFVAQSGAVMTSVLDWATDRGIGFSYMIGVGDMADVDFGDVLNYLAGDPKVRAILLYVEAVTNTRKFMSAARAAARTKPVVVIKAGRKEAGARAASSHTGALAGSDKVYDAAFKRAGMLRVFDMQELFDAVETLSRVSRSMRGEVGPRLGIVTNGGGIGVLATDRLVELGGDLAELSAQTVVALDDALPANWSRANPVDIIGDAPGERYAAAVEAVHADPGVDALLVINCPTAIADSEIAAQAVIDTLGRRHKPVFTSWLGDGAAARARRLFHDRGIPTYDTAEDAVRAFMHLVRYEANQRLLMEVPPLRPGPPKSARSEVRALIDNALEADRAWLSEAEAKKLLEAYEVPVARTLVAATPEDAEEAAKQFGFGDRVAVKILSNDITHKSDVGGVVLNLETPAQAREATAAMLERLRREFPDADVQGVTVQQMIVRPGAQELIVGLSEDSQFGPVVLFGKGGKAVEVVGDTAMGLPPLNAVLARALIGETAISRLLRGYRDEPPADMEALEDVIVKVGQIAIDNPEVAELDINPLIADRHGVVALDARVRLARPTGRAEHRLAIRPYPQELEGEVALRDGRRVPVRPIRPEDAPALKDMVQATTPEDIRLRFLHAMREMPIQLAARLTQIDYAREMAIAALNPEKPGEIIGVARLSADPDGQRAEYAVLVRTDWKGTGLGYALMGDLIEYARARGVGELFGEVLAENRAMLQMCEELGFRIEPLAEAPDVRLVRLALSGDEATARATG